MSGNRRSIVAISPGAPRSTDAPWQRAWDEYVAGAAGAASAYHASTWSTVLTRAFGHASTCLLATEAERVVGVLPLVTFRSALTGCFVVSLPFVNYGGIVADDPEIEQELMTRAIAEAQSAGARYIEFRHDRRVLPALPARQHKVAMTLALPPDGAGLWEGLDRKVRNQVRKAEKSGLESISGGRELLADFYAVFAHNMRDLGTPVYSRRFFEIVVDAFPVHTRIFCVRHQGRTVAAALVYHHDSTVEIPWASALRSSNDVCANVLLYWDVIRWAGTNGFTRIDFGRSTRDSGTFRFKRQWGAVPHDLVWEYWMAGDAPLPDLSPANPRYRTAIAVWRRLPVPVTAAVGPFIARHLP